jgi:glucose 1-dehydrogenase
MRLASKCAIVTGAGRGIGAALAKGFAREGAAVVVNYNASEAAAHEVVEEIRAKGGRAVAVRGDVGDLAQHQPLIDTALGNFDRLDILVNNAAIDRRMPFLDVTPEHWDQVFNVDLKGPYFLAQKVARVMLAGGGGAILNISSVHDEQPHRNNSIYAIAKGGMKLMTRNLALELAPDRIRVNSLSPGAILTDINRQVLSSEDYRRKTLERIPLGRIGDVSELVGAALLPVSDEGSYITGSTFYVDGGLLL